MKLKDQKKYLTELRKYERDLTPKEFDEYKMFIKRDKDEEDFDTVSLNRLKELFDKYYKPSDIHKYDNYFKKKEE
ncbi:MAG: hypothetical protein ACM3O3_09120 [Syntrophothermus sp.]|nr:hypothetical protein [Ignavibacteriaceae bacterium]